MSPGPEGRRFSQRHGYAPGEAEIAIRENAPQGLRSMLFYSADEAGLPPATIRDIVCRAVRVLPDRGNWSASNVWQEAQRLIEDAEWPYVYDFAELLYAHLEQHDPERAATFQEELNRYFHETGIGWPMLNGRVETRGRPSSPRCALPS